MSKFIFLHLRDQRGTRTPFLIATDVIRSVWRDGEYARVWTKDDSANILVYESFEEVKTMLVGRADG